jgi:hypothetical protein
MPTSQPMARIPGSIATITRMLLLTRAANRFGPRTHYDTVQRRPQCGVEATATPSRGGNLVIAANFASAVSEESDCQHGDVITLGGFSAEGANGTEHSLNHVR